MFDRNWLERLISSPRAGERDWLRDPTDEEVVQQIMAVPEHFAQNQFIPAASQTFPQGGIQPVYAPNLALALSVNLPANVTYAKGTMLAEIAGQNEVQLITQYGAPTGGTFTLTFKGRTTGTIAFNAAAATVQTALEALTSIGTGNVAVSGSAGGPYTVTFLGALASTNVPLLTADTSGLTGASAPTIIVTQTPGYGSTGTFRKYVGGDTVRGLLQYDCSTDADGLITFTTDTGGGGGPFGEKLDSAPMWIYGYFNLLDIVEVATTPLNTFARIVHGSIALGGVALIGVK